MIYTELFAKEKFQSHEQWLLSNLLYETIVGSQAYGLATPESDIDIVAIVMPKLEHLWPQRFGYILGFDEMPKFESKDIKGEKSRILTSDGKTDLEGEWNSLVRFFYLTGIKGSPNLIECLFVRRNLVTFSTDIGWKLRDNKEKFLSMRTFQAFKGYAFSQLHRVRNDINRGKTDNPKRQHLLDNFGYDTKMASQVLRLLDQLNQLLDTGTIDLMNNKDEAKAMRKGEWGDWKRFEPYVLERLDILEKKSLIQNVISPQPRLGELKILLSECIETWYGSETELIKQSNETVTVKELWDRLDKLENLIRNLKE
jgi:uncharacterized protein